MKDLDALKRDKNEGCTCGDKQCRYETWGFNKGWNAAIDEIKKRNLLTPPDAAEALEYVRHAIAYAKTMRLDDDDYVEICPAQLKVWKTIRARLAQGDNNKGEIK